jgi:glycosyltransferase involved in cell wall biosynthesis
MVSFLFVDTERVWRGGQDQLFTLLAGLHGRGHKIHLVCQPHTLLETRARELEVSVHPLSIRNETGVVSFLRLLSILRIVRPDVLAFNTPRAILMGTLASRLVCPCVRIIFRRVNFPLRRNPMTHIKYTWGIDCIVAISESIRLQLQMCGIPNSRIRTIYEGMDVSLYPRRILDSTPTGGKPVVVGTVAHLSSEKGHKYLIEAASAIPGVREKLRFVIVGDGECLKELKDLAKRHELEETFQFAGFHSDTSQFMGSFDIFALPSLSEGLSSAILEAMANSLPIVATAVGGIPELVNNGENGLLVAPGDPAALALAIQRLADNPEERRRMGECGRDRMEAQFTLERKIRETEQLCTLLLKGSARSPRSAYV